MLKNHLDIKERINYEEHKFYLYKSAYLLFTYFCYSSCTIICCQTILSFFICLTILVYLVKRWGDETTLDRLPIKWVELRWIIFAYLANLILVVSFIFFTTVLGKAHDNTSSLSFFQHFETSGFFYTVLFWLSTAFTQPLLEEMLFRGIILGTLEKYSPIFAVFLSAVLFGFAHDGEIISQHLVTGLVLGCLYIKQRNLYSCVVVHGLMNATITCLFFLAT